MHWDGCWSKLTSINGPRVPAGGHVKRIKTVTVMEALSLFFYMGHPLSPTKECSNFVLFKRANSFRA